jgi:hypothetical protein
MTIILYPNNKAYSDSNPVKSLGTNETYGIPAQRYAPYGKGKDDVEVYTVGEDTIKAFYTDLNWESREEYLREYNIEYQRIFKPRNFASRNKKRQMVQGVLALLNAI